MVLIRRQFRKLTSPFFVLGGCGERCPDIVVAAAHRRFAYWEYTSPKGFAQPVGEAYLGLPLEGIPHPGVSPGTLR